MPEAVLLSQGNELTTGQTVDTNASWLATELWALGLPVRRKVTVPDRLDDLVGVLRQVAELGDIVVCTGGLGPTRDDLTAEAVAQAFGRELYLDEPALAQIAERYARYGRELTPANRKQALLPTGCTVLENRWGTAPGFAVDVERASGGRCRLYFMPGVPREMKAMFATWVGPDLLGLLRMDPPVMHTVRVVGVAESALEEMLQQVDVPGLTIGFRTKLPENQVKLVFDAGVDPAVRAAAVEQVRGIIGPKAFGVDSGDLAEVVGQRLAARGETLALAESCTAGLLSSWLTEAPGASAFLLEGAVVYSNAAKVRACGVSESELAAHGAVSEPVARQLARGIRQRAGSTWGIGITGIAGPSGGSEDKPVGTVHVALAGPEVDYHRRLQLPGDRRRVRQFSAAAALGFLLRHLR